MAQVIASVQTEPPFRPEEAERVGWPEYAKQLQTKRDEERARMTAE